MSDSPEAIPSGLERAQLDKAWTSESLRLSYGIFSKIRRVRVVVLGWTLPYCGFFDDS